ncbi:MAG: hypothetical protein C3F02_01615 [Parcubacteria group bacterium]|nr:MAG: hypothetical protein C3F02_01615 [Parcubacteria group bacterium]
MGIVFFVVLGGLAIDRWPNQPPSIDVLVGQEGSTTTGAKIAFWHQALTTRALPILPLRLIDTRRLFEDPGKAILPD